MRKFLITMMCVIMVACFMPTVAMAGTLETDVAKIGEQGYETLQSALNAANEGDTITLLKSIEGAAVVFERDVNATLDLNSNTFKATSNGNNTSHRVIKVTKGTLTIQNGTLDARNEVDGTDDKDDNNMYGTVRADGGNVILKNLTLYNNHDWGMSIKVCMGYTGSIENCNVISSVGGGLEAEGGNITVKNSTFTQTGSNTKYPYIASGLAVSYGGTVNIENTEFTTSGDYALYVFSSGGTINAKSGVFTGGKGVAVVQQDHSTYPDGKSIINIFDGTYNGEIKSNGGEYNEVNTTGGTFSDLGVLSYLGEDADVTVKLNNDVTGNVTIPSGKTVTLDLNGNKIESNTDDVISNHGNLVITDSSVGEAGKLLTSASGKGAIVNYPGGVARLDGGTFTANSWYAIKNMGDMYINAGAKVIAGTQGASLIDNGWYGNPGTDRNVATPNDGSMAKLTIDGGSFSGGMNTVKNDDAGFLIINEGTFSNNTDNVILNWNIATINGGDFSIENNTHLLANGYLNESVDKGQFKITGGTFTASGAGKGNILGFGVGGKNGGFLTISGGDFAGVLNGTGLPYTVTVTGGTFSSDVKTYMGSGVNEYKKDDGSYIVSATSPANSSGKNSWVKGEDGIYTETYVSISVPPTPTTPTDNVTNSGTSGTDNATTSADLSGSTSTSNGTTSATVDKTTADKIVDKAVENNSGEVVIDATANSSTAASSTTIAQVTIPTETLGAIAEKTEADVTIKTDVAEVKMDNAAAAAVAEQAEGDTVQIIAEKVAEETDKVEFELKVVCSDGKVISDFKGGNVAVTVALPKEMAEKKVVCVYIDDNGHMSKMEGKKNADGTYTFNTGHFSSYAIMAEEEADAVIAAQKEAIKNIKIKLTSKQVKTKAGKKAVKITWTADAGDKVLDGVEVYRSTERYKGYGTEPFYTSTKGGNTGSYTNTKSLKKGNKYYYRVRGYVLVDGQKVYTDYSTKAWRTVK